MPDRHDEAGRPLLSLRCEEGDCHLALEIPDQIRHLLPQRTRRAERMFCRAMHDIAGTKTALRKGQRALSYSPGEEGILAKRLARLEQRLRTILFQPVGPAAAALLGLEKRQFGDLRASGTADP